MALTRHGSAGHQPLGRDKDSGFVGPMSEVPTALLQQLLQRPLPITIGGSNNVTFTLNASVTNPVPIWNGQGFTLKKETVAYTWNNTENNILDSTGAATTDADSVLGIWYMYLNSAGDTLWPSQTAPGYVEAAVDYPAQMLGHPGTSRADNYRYVGFMECTTAATPAFRAAIKTGYWYKFAPVSIAIITDAWTAPTNATLSIPRVPGVEVQGTLETGADGSVHIGSHSASTIWDAELDISEATASNVAQQIVQAPVRFSVNESATPWYAIAAGTSAPGDFHLLGVKDAV